jgi:hypothetical protein
MPTSVGGLCHFKNDAKIWMMAHPQVLLDSEERDRRHSDQELCRAILLVPSWREIVSLQSEAGDENEYAGT